MRQVQRELMQGPLAPAKLATRYLALYRQVLAEASGDQRLVRMV